MKLTLPATVLCLLASCSSTGVDRVTSAEGAPEVSPPGVECPAGADCFAPEVCADKDMTCETGDDCFAPDVCGEAGTLCPAGEECLAPDVCADLDVVCPTGEECFAPEACGEELDEVYEEACTESCIDS